MSWLNLDAMPLIGRICLVLLFPFSALDKIVHWDAVLKQANSSFIPGGPALLVIAIAIELAAPTCIVAGWHDRIAAFILAGFCVVTAVLYHPFWAHADFWTPGDSKGRRNFWDFLKNLGLAGGLLLAMIVADFVPARAIIEQPLSSAPKAASSLTAHAVAAGQHPANAAPMPRTGPTP
jgi:putative oxidoreductase